LNKNKLLYLDYSFVKKFMKPGDVIAFSGDGFISSLIKWKTKSDISHIGCLVEHNNNLKLIESTTLKKKSGVSYCSITDRYNTYNGSLYWFPLERWSYHNLDVCTYTEFLHDQNGKEYDTIGAILSAIIIYGKEDFSKMFCSELVCAAFKAGGIAPYINCSEMTPIDVLKLPVFGKYYQFKGEKKTLDLSKGEHGGSNYERDF